MHSQTRKQLLYFKEVIRLHYEYGYGEDRISRILPIGHSTVSRWLAIFAAENDVKSVPMRKRKRTKATPPSPEVPAGSELKTLEREVSRLQTQLKAERLRADAYEEMIKVAETKFKIAIRKKAGAKR
ncbi:MAG: transposase [Prevotellaceae bacterium]|jgi:DNA-binding transcriptional regulator LsrR (DeoR family)|nr:transposase [Prevotellaceae bacterium]